MDDVGYLAREQEALSPKLIVKLEVKELACMKESERNSKANHARKHHLRCVKQTSKQKGLGRRLAGANGCRTHHGHLRCPSTDLKSAKLTGAHSLPHSRAAGR